MKNNYYKVYGLNIKSQIEINEFIKDKSENHDLEFVLGEMPDAIKELKVDGRKKGFSKAETWFHIDNVASYYITNGDTIIVEPCENYDVKLLKIYLMCSGLGFIMLQRDMVALHGGTIVINNKAVLFTGDRGAGKSTITSALRNKGYKFIADDVASTYINEKPYVVHGFPYQKLCEDALVKLGYDKNAYESFMGDGKRKYLIPSHNSFVEEDTKLQGIFELTIGDVEAVEIEEVRGAEKLNRVIKNIYRIEYIDKVGGVTPKMFKQCLEIAKYIKFYKITRPIKGFTVNTQIELIEEVLNSNKEEKVV
ncbi:MAG: hypothetical protein ACRC68_18265 [Clostridium sp.]